MLNRFHEEYEGSLIPRKFVLDYGSHWVQVYQKEAHPLEPHEIPDVQRSPSIYTQFSGLAQAEAQHASTQS